MGNVNHVLMLLIATFLSSISAESKSSEIIVRVYADHNNDTHIVLGTKEAVIRPKPDQAGIDQVKIADDHRTAGWLILFPDPNNSPIYRSSDIPQSLVIWRNGKIVRTFEPEQTFWSWSFVDGGDRVAYHSGPLHGERSSHCELREVSTGRLLASWDGDLDQADRPGWTKSLDH